MKRTVVLNDFGELSARSTTRKSGEKVTHYTTTIRAEPVLTSFDAKALGKGPALAIAAHLRQRVGDLGQASRGTIALRERNAKVLRGETQGPPTQNVDKIRRRYARAVNPPGTQDKVFNDTGRMREGIKVGAASGNRWIVNVPRDRFDPSTLGGGEAALIAIYGRLRELIPEWGDGRRLREVLTVRAAIKAATPLIDPRIVRKEIGRLGKRFLRGALGALNDNVNLRSTARTARESLELLAM